MTTRLPRLASRAKKAVRRIYPLRREEERVQGGYGAAGPLPLRAVTATEVLLLPTVAVRVYVPGA